ncbi:MFS transporter [Candidatus Villigracilis saccharophilus]|uniref:MFS transporter n=1 Tax=Candidatus Villigracilis saccharophilus TaxID=3140684 RepID=UPI0031365746|nr:MFS transporter [Anaerolineales bacterium]
MNFLTNVKQYPKIGLVILSFVAFVALGMPDGLLGVAWPSIRGDFSIPLDAIGMFLTALVIGYMTSSFFSGPIVTRFGVGKVLAISCILTGIALFGYTFVPEWWMMVLLGVIAGFGAGAIDAGLNTYVAAHFSEGLMQWLHASWGVGITLGPIIMTLGLSNTDTWHTGYRIVGGFQLFLAACFVLTLPMWSDNDKPAAHDEPKKLTDYKTPMSETMHQPRVWMSALLFFLYVGAEGALGTWIYTLLTESRGIDPTLAGFWAGSYWATFTVGRVIAGLFANRIGINKLVIGGLLGALVGAVILVWNPSDEVNLLAVAIIGFCIAPIFPAMMSGTSKRVGDYFAANTIGMQMTATGLGTAVIPGVMGIVAKQVSLETIPLILLGVYAGLLGVYLAVSK